MALNTEKKDLTNKEIHDIPRVYRKKEILRKQSKDITTINSSYVEPPNSAIGRAISQNILDHWNTKKIIVHKKLDRFLKPITQALEDHSPDDIIRAIDTYAAVYHSLDTYWNHAFKLDRFLTSQQTGLETFLMPTDKCLAHFRRYDLPPIREEAERGLIV